VVLVDARLPGVEGYTLPEWMEIEPRLAGRVILTVSPGQRQELARRGRTRNVAAYLERPVAEADLGRALEKALRGAVSAKQTAALAPDQMPERPSDRPLRVLLAEDTPANQKLVVRLLNKRGHVVEVAHNGQEAVQLARQGTFDAVLMDVQMPVMDGFQATAAIRAQQAPNQRRLPIIAMTAHAMKGDQERCLEAGMDAYLAKPIDGRELIETLERAVQPLAPLGEG
jgi:CheY-like chemotaxis protein